MHDQIDLAILPDVIARVPRHVGFNVEIQEHHDQLNLWDWIADSNATILREFHPEVKLRHDYVKPGAWGTISNRGEFDAFRARVVTNPAKDSIRWSEFLFGKHIDWMGIPDAAIGKVTELGVSSLIGLNYAPKMFPRPLVSDISFVGIPDDERIDWEAATSAYEYYFALIYHYASSFGSIYFNMINEPEFRWGWFYLPADLENILGDKWFPKLFRNGVPVEVRRRYFETIGTQYMVMAQLARTALEDVRIVLDNNPVAAQMVLTGPTTGKWESFWDNSSTYFDFFDYHHYSPEPAAFRARYSRVASILKGSDKRISISEFNLRAGEMNLADFYFPIQNSIAFAGMVMEIMSVAVVDEPVCEFACVYLLNFPSTHRNYKQLLYGDMNMLDWSGSDERLWSKGPEWHPDANDMQVRFATPAFHMFRMLARCAGRGCSHAQLPKVIGSPLTTPDSAVAPVLCDKLKTQAIDTGECVYVNVLNSSSDHFENFVLDISAFPGRFTHAVIRETARATRDQVKEQQSITEPVITLQIGPWSLTQIILTPLDLGAISSIRLQEQTFTPGSVKNLELWQTSRLRAIALIGDTEHDVSELDVVWTSSEPHLIRADQAGLVQRIRSGSRETTITAALPDASVSASVRIPGNVAGVLEL